MTAFADDEAIVRSSERRVRGILRGQYRGFDSDDLRQEGRLAIHIARREGRVPDDAEHAQRYLLRRTQGAMLDAVRADRRQLPHNALEWLPELDTRSHVPAPYAGLAARQSIERLMRRATARTLECVELLAMGADDAEVAAAMRVTTSRVSQYRVAARAIVEEW